MKPDYEWLETFWKVYIFVATGVLLAGLIIGLVMISS